jgi:hypothetical protein
MAGRAGYGWLEASGRGIERECALIEGMAKEKESNNVLRGWCTIWLVNDTEKDSVAVSPSNKAA